jgi:hypothetical protein
VPSTEQSLDQALLTESPSHEQISVTDIATVHVAEYQALRQEVNNRQTVSNALIAADLTALGVGVSVAHQYPAILIGLGVVSSLLWLFWLVHTLQIYRIALYVALELRPRLVGIYKCTMLDWEAYVRFLTFSRAAQARLLAKYHNSGDPSVISRNIDGIYVSLLLGGATPLLLAASVVADIHSKPSNELAWALAVAATLILWLYALGRAVVTLRTTRAISDLIIRNQDNDDNGYGLFSKVPPA